MVYAVKDWDRHFEKSDTRKCKRMTWVAVPNKHDGKSYKRLAAHRRGLEIYAAWMLILQVASKMPVRGVLQDEDGPLDAEDLAFMTSFPAEVFDMALEVLSGSKIAWLITQDYHRHSGSSGSFGTASGNFATTGQDKTGQLSVGSNNGSTY